MPTVVTLYVSVAGSKNFGCTNMAYVLVKGGNEVANEGKET